MEIRGTRYNTDRIIMKADKERNHEDKSSQDVWNKRFAAGRV